jgi:hypothetical protein
MKKSQNMTNREKRYSPPYQRIETKTLDETRKLSSLVFPPNSAFALRILGTLAN